MYIRHDMLNHSHKKRKDSLETLAVLLTLYRDRNWSSRTGDTSKHRNMAAFSEEFLSENDYDAVLATFCCCEYGCVCYDLLKRQNQHLFLTRW